MNFVGRDNSYTQLTVLRNAEELPIIRHETRAICYFNGLQGWKNGGVALCETVQKPLKLCERENLVIKTQSRRYSPINFMEDFAEEF
ncbi:unnamed protein product [Ceratitis capitata]|uniref:(Mediterranean fruit fly) hypothetical protein n=1 Tax=Ceratitis capitata TaxID=7213 RepID=A0A811U0M0_CERCA|nr:unnamed protein product [Ceratitis capitata]